MMVAVMVYNLVELMALMKGELRVELWVGPKEISLVGRMVVHLVGLKVHLMVDWLGESSVE